MLICYETNKQKEEICQIARDCGIVFYPECVEIRANNIDKATAIQKSNTILNLITSSALVMEKMILK